ncbi:hypothetical protein GCM10011495_10540 [Hymenobacter frigidus]|uniref:Uncharacterized protein n=1 Tax=Hymenobacter frigidus TaxID=1524095 RepID=A0ABQ1ZYD8_9BACT|nr:hypothetical protein GCM10011495_10540 [Hymenobacter frigidus]
MMYQSELWLIYAEIQPYWLGFSPEFLGFGQGGGKLVGDEKMRTKWRANLGLCAWLVPARTLSVHAALEPAGQAKVNLGRLQLKRLTLGLSDGVHELK